MYTTLYTLVLAVSSRLGIWHKNVRLLLLCFSLLVFSFMLLLLFQISMTHQQADIIFVFPKLFLLPHCLLIMMLINHIMLLLLTYLCQNWSILVFIVAKIWQ